MFPDFNRSAKLPGQLRGNVQAQAGVASFTLPGFVTAVKFIQCLFQIFRAKAASCIADNIAQPVFFRLYGNVYSAALRGILQAVGDDVVKDTCQFIRVSADRTWYPLRKVKGEGDSLLPGRQLIVLNFLCEKYSEYQVGTAPVGGRIFQDRRHTASAGPEQCFSLCCP